MIGLVAGFGRCGSSMVMRMLQAGGLPIVGKAPLFETIEFSSQGTVPSFLQRNDGRILKWINPIDTYLPHEFRGCPILWLDRDPAQWAESWMKLERLWQETPLRADDPEAHAALVAKVQHRTKDAVRIAEERGHVRRLSFEEILADPVGAAEILADHFRPFGSLNVREASCVVSRRSPDCAPGMEFDQVSAFVSVFGPHGT